MHGRSNSCFKPSQLTLLGSMRKIPQDRELITKLLSTTFVYLIIKSLGVGWFIPECILVLMISGLIFKNLFKLDPRKQSIIDGIATIKGYQAASGRMISRRYQLFNKMSFGHRKQAIDVGYLSRLDRLKGLYADNNKLMNNIAEHALLRYKVSNVELKSARNVGSPFELFELLVRDWSQFPEGLSYLTEMIQRYSPIKNGRLPTVLVPGAGLGRAAHEIAGLGYKVDAIDFSHLMAMVSDFMINSSDSYKIYPYTHQFSHKLSEESQCRSVMIPDVKPKVKVQYGDFTKWAQESGDQYDVIVTLFFMDTAENIFTYLDNIDRLLKPGGIWINLGPLKWGTAPQAELTLEELKKVIENRSYQILNEYSSTDEYFPDDQSLWSGIYGTAGWVAVK